MDQYYMDKFQQLLKPISLNKRQNSNCPKCRILRIEVSENSRCITCNKVEEDIIDDIFYNLSLKKKFIPNLPNL